MLLPMGLSRFISSTCATSQSQLTSPFWIHTWSRIWIISSPPPAEPGHADHAFASIRNSRSKARRLWIVGLAPMGLPEGRQDGVRWLAGCASLMMVTLSLSG